VKKEWCVGTDTGPYFGKGKRNRSLSREKNGCVQWKGGKRGRNDSKTRGIARKEEYIEWVKIPIRRDRGGEDRAGWKIDTLIP